VLRTKEKRVFYVPNILQGVLFKPVYMSDAIHPNDEGYNRVAERLEKVLRPLLPKLKPQPVGESRLEAFISSEPDSLIANRSLTADSGQR